MKLLPLAMPFLSSIALASSAIQTDWSGGSGVHGPVLTWGNSYDTDSGISSFQIPGILQLGAGPPEATVLFTDNTGVHDVCSADIDGDGFRDILILSGASVGNAWWRNIDGYGETWEEHPIYMGDRAEPRTALANDVDGDGDLDVIGSTYESVVWWENADGTGDSWITHVVDPSCAPYSVCASDIDGDGHTDIAAISYDSSNVSWWENVDGTGTAWAVHSVDPQYVSGWCIASSDVNSDGSPDLVTGSVGPESVVWWENMDGEGLSWEQHTVASSYAGASTSGGADLDGDGDIDILGSSLNLEEVVWWENLDGSGDTWLMHVVASDFGAYEVAAGDLDDDGDLDLAGVAFWEIRISWWENLDGSGTSWGRHELEGLGRGVKVGIDDLDLDGHEDVFAQGGIAGSLVWWDLATYLPSAWLESSILDTQTEPDWGVILWTASTPSGTTITFQVRASDDPENMGVWSDTLAAPCSLQGILGDGDRYLQYRALLASNCPHASPTLNEVSFTWDPLGTGGSGGPEGYILSLVDPNPSGPSPSLSFGLPKAALVEISVFDISGRIVQSFEPAEYQAGYHTIQLQPLGSGIYFVQMRAGEFSANQRFAVVE